MTAAFGGKMANYIDQFTHPVPVDPRQTALVVVDMQYASGSRNHGLGAFLQREGKLADAEYRFSRIENLIVPNIQKLLAAWRSAGAPVIYLTVGARNADYSDAPPHVRKFFQICNNYRGSKENEIVEELKPLPDEPVYLKNTMGAFASVDLAKVFDDMGVKSAVYTGVSTNNCVDTTAREAADRGYGSILVSDATGTCSETMQNTTLASFQRLFGQVMTTEEVIGLLQRVPA